MTAVLARQHEGDWQKRLPLIVDLMRDMSRQTDPQEMVRSYAEKVRHLLPSDARISLSRRGLTAPKYRITRSTAWRGDINPWEEKARLPLFQPIASGRYQFSRAGAVAAIDARPFAHVGVARHLTVDRPRGTMVVRRIFPSVFNAMGTL